MMMMSQPSLPPELIALILSHLRGWLPFARNELDVLLTPADVPTFLELVASPKTTMLPNVRSLTIWSSPQSPVSAILRMLPSFASLRSLQLGKVILESQPPALPFVEILGLTETTFQSYTCFRDFMAGLPALHTLALDSVAWITGPENEEYVFPLLELQSLELDWEVDGLALEIVTRVIRTRRLKLVVPTPPPSTVLAAIAAYLRYLGNHLRQLEIDHAGFEMDEVDRLDFSQSSGLSHLEINHALYFHLPTGGEPSMWVRPILLSLVSQMMLHVPTIVLVAHCGLTEVDLWTPLAEFTELMDSPPFLALRTIQFIVDGSRCLNGSARLARAKCEPILRAAIKDCHGRKIECYEGEDGKMGK